MAGYVRVDTSNNISDGNVIAAADLDNEFDGIQAAFNASTGHNHDGTTGEGAPILVLGPTQDVVVGASTVTPKTTNTVDIGSSSLKFKDLYLAGNASIAGTLGVTGATTLSAALTYGGVTLSNAVTGTGNMVLSASPTLTGTLSGANASLSGTLAVTGVATLTAQPILSSLTASQAVFTDGSKGLVSNAITGTGNVVMSASPTLTGTISAEALTTSSTVTLNGGTANGVAYLNGSKVLTSGSALTFDGTNLGVGNSSPTNAITVGTTSAGKNIALYSSSNGNNGLLRMFDVGGTERLQLGANSTGEAVYYSPTGSVHAWYINTEQMRLTSTGLGIGTSSPGSKLTVSSTGSTIELKQNGTGAATYYVMDNTIETGGKRWRFGYTGGAGIPTFSLLNQTDNVLAWASDASGNLGIGTSSPSSAYSGAARVAMVAATGSNAASLRVSSANASAELYSAGSATDWGLYSASNSPFAIYTNSVRQLVIDSSGNLGLGVTPSAWYSTYKAIQIGSSGALYNAGTSDFIVATNAYVNASGTYTYLNTNYATNYEQYNGKHQWFTAPSGTAGNAISFTQAMTLDASGNLGIGVTSVGDWRLNVSKGSAGNIAQFSDGVTSTFVITTASGSTASIGQANNGPLAFLTNNTERARIDSSGNLLVGTTSVVTVSGLAGTNAISTGTNSNWATTIRHTNTDPWGLAVGYSGASPNTTGNGFYWAADTTATRFLVYSNGGVLNYQANDGNLSDRREKTNFAPAGDYLTKICAIPVQTFNYIDQNMEEDGGLTLGVVAQDVQAVAPELVMESDWSAEKDGSKMRLSIYQTDLQYALMKCIQEQQAIITALTARVAALESN